MIKNYGMATVDVRAKSSSVKKAPIKIGPFFGIEVRFS